MDKESQLEKSSQSEYENINEENNIKEETKTRQKLRNRNTDSIANDMPPSLLPFIENHLKDKFSQNAFQKSTGTDVIHTAEHEINKKKKSKGFKNRSTKAKDDHEQTSSLEMSNRHITDDKSFYDRFSYEHYGNNIKNSISIDEHEEYTAKSESIVEPIDNTALVDDAHEEGNEGADLEQNNDSLKPPFRHDQRTSNENRVIVDEGQTEGIVNNHTEEEVAAGLQEVETYGDNEDEEHEDIDKESNEKEEGSSAAGGENAESLISEKDYSGYGNYKEVSIK